MKRTTKFLIALVVVLVVARLLLPYVVLRYVNKVLADMGSYTGRIDDVDIQLIRGAYQIDNLVIRKVNGKIKEPFVDVPKIDLSVEWKSLFKGKLVGEIEAYEPELNFAFSESEAASQTGEEYDWTQLVKELLPIQINRFAVINGRVDLTNVVSQPRSDLSLRNVQLLINNISNADEKPGNLPTPVTMTGDVPGWGGTLRFDANTYLLKQVPDFNYNLKLLNLQLVKLNPLAKQYANIDFEGGTLDVFSEMAMNDGKLVGYLKPLTKGMKIFKLKEEGEKRTVGRFFTELLAEAGSEVLENQRKDQVATRIPLRGTIENVQTDFWPTLAGVLRNAYVEAFRGEFDGDITFSDALKNLKEDYKAKRAERKAERKERREQRKQERQERREQRRQERQTN